MKAEGGRMKDEERQGRVKGRTEDAGLGARCSVRGAGRAGPSKGGDCGWLDVLGGRLIVSYDRNM